MSVPLSSLEAALAVEAILSSQTPYQEELGSTTTGRTLGLGRSFQVGGFTPPAIEATVGMITGAAGTFATMGLATAGSNVGTAISQTAFFSYSGTSGTIEALLRTGAGPSEVATVGYGNTSAITGGTISGMTVSDPLVAAFGHHGFENLSPLLPPATETPSKTLVAKYLSLLRARHNSLTTNQSLGLQRQIQGLLGDEAELSAHGIDPSTVSFDGLIAFLSQYGTRHPSLSLSASGLFVASWSPTKRSKLTLTFKNAAEGTWVGVDLETASSGKGEFRVAHRDLPKPYSEWI